MSSMASGGEPKAEALLWDLWKEHSVAVAGGVLGIGLAFQEFFCQSCRQRYPCSTAREIAKWGLDKDEQDLTFLTLRAAVKGEVINKDQTTATYTWGPDHHATWGIR